VFRDVGREISVKRLKLRLAGRGVAGYESLAVGVAVADGKLVEDDDVRGGGGGPLDRALLLGQQHRIRAAGTR
jgi:hypothetical protein